jgi:hypothetical protein
VAPVPGQEFQKASRAAWRLSKVAIGADLVGEPDAAELAADVVACLGVQDEPSRRIRDVDQAHDILGEAHRVGVEDPDGNRR